MSRNAAKLGRVLEADGINQTTIGGSDLQPPEHFSVGVGCGVAPRCSEKAACIVNRAIVDAEEVA